MYFIYLDESGTSNLKQKNVREESDFFVLGGLLIKEKDLKECDKKFEKFKQENLPKEFWNYSIHAVELNQISKHKKTEYKKILTDKQGKEFLEKIYKLINTFPIEAIAVLIDNHELKEKYINPTNPYSLSYEFIIEKTQKIIEKRNDENNCIGMVNLAECSQTLTKELKRIHGNFMAKGTKYKKLDNIFYHLNIEDNKKSHFYEIADLICYAFRRSYYSWLCKHLNKMPIKEDYLSTIKDVCTLRIGHILIGNTEKGEGVHIKVFPDPRFLEKKENKKEEKVKD